MQTTFIFSIDKLTDTKTVGSYVQVVRLGVSLNIKKSLYI